MTEYEVITSRDGTIWINGIHGLLARFSKRGIDIHSDLPDGHCVREACAQRTRCKTGFTSSSDWQAFKTGVLEIHGIDLDKELPDFDPFGDRFQEA